MKFVVDAHTLIWYFRDDPRLGKSAGDILDDDSSQIVVPATALAEVFWIIEHKPTKVGTLTIEAVKSAITADPRVTISPLTRRIIEKSTTLTAIHEMHDRQIAATVAVMIDDGDLVSLITCDKNITASGYIPIIW